MKQPIIVLITLDISATNDELATQMRAMREHRLQELFNHITCVIAGFDDDKRELNEIPEVRAFCRRLVKVGFISFLDFATALPGCQGFVAGSLGASEIYLISENRIGQEFDLDAYLKEFSAVLSKSNERADRLLK